MKTILKWPGGKEKELQIIQSCMPIEFKRYIEPFLGGGAVFFNVKSPVCCVNDRSAELINFYQCITKKNPDFIHYLELQAKEFTALGTFVENHPKDVLDLYHSQISVNDFIHKHIPFFSQLADNYNTIFLQELKKNLNSKIKRSQTLETKNGELPDKDRLDNIEASLKSAYYMFIRYLQNRPSELSPGRQAAVFFFIREYCYSSMFRYNKKGEFNVPYGGISYNKKDLQKKIDYLLSDSVYQKLKNADICCNDFETFLNGLHLTQNDFIFLDPPYDSNFSTYAQNHFDAKDQIRLCEFLKRTPANFLLVIKNTEFIYNLYKDNFQIRSFDKKYMVSFMNRNDRTTQHLLITNYDIPKENL